jgi:hypothetical protein
MFCSGCMLLGCVTSNKCTASMHFQARSRVMDAVECSNMAWALCTWSEEACSFTQGHVQADSYEGNACQQLSPYCTTWTCMRMQVNAADAMQHASKYTCREEAPAQQGPMLCHPQHVNTAVSKSLLSTGHTCCCCTSSLPHSSKQWVDAGMHT